MVGQSYVRNFKSRDFDAVLIENEIQFLARRSTRVGGQTVNIRSVVINFGRRRKAGLLLTSFLEQWLPELESIQAFHTAQKHHGGSGAVYVLIRKSERQRIANSERHATRRGA